jgi:hypothetical protein
MQGSTREPHRHVMKSYLIPMRGSRKLHHPSGLGLELQLELSDSDIKSHLNRAAATMGVPFEALLPYAIMASVCSPILARN